MKVVLARTAGFCMGVHRAMKIARDLAADHAAPIFTDGPLIHNPQAVAELESLGVTALTDAPPEGAIVIIRAHGISPQELQRLRSYGVEIVDATCPHVLRNHELIKGAIRENRHVVIVGDRGHPEVEALLGLAQDEAFLVHAPEDVASLDLSPGSHPVLLAQTTFCEQTFLAIADAMKRRFPGCDVYDSVCSATVRRQQEVDRLVKTVDALVVVGGYKSANTCRLAEIGRNSGLLTFHVETADELDLSAFNPNWTVAVTAGASTPDRLTNEVINRLKTL